MWGQKGEGRTWELPPALANLGNAGPLCGTVRSGKEARNKTRSISGTQHWRTPSPYMSTKNEELGRNLWNPNTTECLEELANSYCYRMMALHITHTPSKRHLLLLLLSHFSRILLYATTTLGFSRQEHWSGLPFPSPMHKSEKWKWSHSDMSDSS